MRYSVRQVHSPREAFGAYRYEIFDGSQLVARYWHDYRGDDHGIEFLDGRRDEWPVGRMIEFLTGGGSMPLGLSAAAERYLTKQLTSK